jgi:FlaG protein
MDSGLSIRPIATGAEAAMVRPEAAPVKTAVATMLAPSKSVTAAHDTSRSAAEDSRNAAAQQSRREFSFDAQTREVIFRVIDVRTEQVERQVPDAALLRMRAYTRAMAEGKSPLDPDAQAESSA